MTELAITTFPSLEKLQDALDMVGSYARMPLLLDLYWPLAENRRLADWYTLLGRNWSCCDNIGEHLDDLMDLLPDVGPVEELMDAAERAAFAALPEVVTVYRGAGKQNRWGASWSLSRDTAARFPHLARYWQKVPMLYTAQVEKRRILALKLDRGEDEVVTLGARIVRSTRLSRPVKEACHD